MLEVSRGEYTWEDVEEPMGMYNSSCEGVFWPIGMYMLSVCATTPGGAFL
jgi:hypothetical protein